MWRSDLLYYLCYPSFSRSCAEERASELAGLGVLGATRLLGKGHSSTVLEVSLAGGGRAALKVLRTDSKRSDLLAECEVLGRAYPVSPRVASCGRYYILMELVEGVPVVEALSRAESKLPLVLKVISAGRGLDILGVDHRELSRAQKHVFLTVDGRVKILDYESASPSERPRNVCRLTSWLLSRVLHLERELRELAGLLREYKRADEGERRDVFRELVERVAMVVELPPGPARNLS